MARQEKLNLNSPEQELDEDLLTLQGVAATLYALATPNDPFPKPSRDDTGRQMIPVVSTIHGEQIKNIRLGENLAHETGLGKRVHADVVGTADSGIAVVLNSAKPFSSRRHGFSLKPMTTIDDFLLLQRPRDFVVSHGEVHTSIPETISATDILGRRACQELFEGNEPTPCTPEMAADFLLAIRERLNRYED